MCEPREVGLNVDDEKNDETRKENRTDDEDFRRIIDGAFGRRSF